MIFHLISSFVFSVVASPFLSCRLFSCSFSTRFSVQVCSAFKATYFDFQDMAANECPQNPWAVTPAAIFVRLNAFMERCMDMAELCQT